jgi:hypothetical protein
MNSKLAVAAAGAVFTLIVTLVVGITVALLTAHLQDQSAASQSLSAGQVQATLAMEADAVNQYASTMAVHNFQIQCASHSTSPGTWDSCAGEAPQFTLYSNDVLAFDTGMNNLADRKAEALAARFVALCAEMIGAASSAQADHRASEVVDSEVALTEYLGEMVQSGR